MKVIKTTLSDISAVAQSHILAFPNSVSSQMGLGFCKKMLEWFVLNDRGVLFHAENEKDVVGYVSLIIKTASGQPGSFSTISQYAFKSVLISLLIKPWLLFHPMFRSKYKTIKRIVLSKVHFCKKNELQERINRAPKNEINVFQPQIGIVGIGVNPQYQGKGYGSALIRQCIAYCKANGFTTIDLSVHHDNSQAIAAYKRNGFEAICIKEDGDLYMKLSIQ